MSAEQKHGHWIRFLAKIQQRLSEAMLEIMPEVINFRPLIASAVTKLMLRLFMGRT
jgi:hypothetical protein